jgi:membrane-bound lytic murein transglycosylase D
MDLRLAAHFSATDLGDLRRFNAGYRQDRMPDASLHRLLLPNGRVARFQSASGSVPPAMWSDWREERAARTSGLASWAEQLGVPVGVLATANAIDESSTVLPNTRLLLPGREVSARATTDKASARSVREHVIVAGDTLSGVAHRYSIPLQQLKRMNPRAGGTLRLGDRLRLETDAG